MRLNEIQALEALMQALDDASQDLALSYHIDVGSQDAPDELARWGGFITGPSPVYEATRVSARAMSILNGDPAVWRPERFINPERPEP